MLVSVNVRKEYHPNAIVVPRTAVFQSDAGANVYTVVDAPAPPGGPAAAGGHAPGGPPGPPPPKIMQAKQLPVTIGLQTDTLTEIRSAQIGAGTTVITTRPDALQDKSLVAIAAPAGGAPGGAQ